MSRSNLLFIVSGSIAAYKACDVISQLVQREYCVRVVATESALRFIGPATLEGLTGSPVMSDLFEEGKALEHITLTRWADAVVVCPATANTINRLAAGLGDDLVGALFLAHERHKPWLIAPAMNPAMWCHPATGAAVEQLRSWGIRFLPVGNGHTACGETGEGRLAEPAVIVAAVEATLARPARRLRVLITSGGTVEPVDGVRVLTNNSTGRTGAGIATHLVACGHEAVLLRARRADRPSVSCREEIFETIADLESALARLLGAERFDAVIHAAAVSDFAVESVVVDGQVYPPGGTKLDSGHPPLLRLKSHPKLIDRIRGLSSGPLKLVAFKLTEGATITEAAAAVEKLFAQGDPDYVVHNDLAERGEGPDEFPGTIHARLGGTAMHCLTRKDLAVTLEKLLTVPNSTP